MGKSGWVTAEFTAGQKPPVDLLKAWIDESYRAQAPKKLSAGLAAGAPPSARKTAASRKKAVRSRSKPRARPARRVGAAKR